MTRPVASAAVAAALLLPVLAGCAVLTRLTGEPPRDDSGKVTARTDAKSTNLRLGDCVTDLDKLTDEVDRIPVTPCDAAHQGEVYAGQELTGSKFPEDLDVTVEEFCFDAVNDFLGGRPTGELSYLEILSLFPTKQTWLFGDRSVQCVIYDPAGGLTGTLRDSAPDQEA